MGGNEGRRARESGKVGRSLSKLAFRQTEQWSLRSATLFKDHGNTPAKEEGSSAKRKGAVQRGREQRKEEGNIGMSIRNRLLNNRTVTNACIHTEANTQTD